MLPRWIRISTSAAVFIVASIADCASALSGPISGPLVGAQGGVRFVNVDVARARSYFENAGSKLSPKEAPGEFSEAASWCDDAVSVDRVLPRRSVSVLIRDDDATRPSFAVLYAGGFDGKRPRIITISAMVRLPGAVVSYVEAIRAIRGMCWETGCYVQFHPLRTWHGGKYVKEELLDRCFLTG